ncbi:hypothetical protein G8759_25860 [Spirosoma aureum]|uniref:Uncharacterized protein n=1 Tax=Spirosoma aureum TaxID=2692134 RepID=A0A6G9ATL2_9BACT|nr:hypothetical protein [Spirosoma aureum]QIP15811.1 hypothetical protein G8759_25860 [Spirosoma aureum]
MANNQKSTKKVATKAGKVHGSPKVPKYEQREAASALALSPAKPDAKGRK